MQSRWTWKLTYSHGSTMEGSNNLRRHAATARTTRKEGASGCRAQRGASDRSTNPIRQDEGKAPRTTPDPEQGARRRTWNHNMEQGRILERAKYNRSSHPQREPPGNIPRGTGCAEKTQTEVRSLTRKLTTTPDPNGDTIPSFRSKTNEPQPRRGYPITKVGNPSGEEDPLEQGELEPDGGRRTGKKPREPKAQQAVCTQPQV